MMSFSSAFYDFMPVVSLTQHVLAPIRREATLHTKGDDSLRVDTMKKMENKSQASQGQLRAAFGYFFQEAATSLILLLMWHHRAF